MCLAAVRCRVDSYALHAKCQMLTAAYILCIGLIYAVQCLPCQMPNAHCLHFLRATALLGILTPHTFSTNGTEAEKKNRTLYI